MCNITEKAKNYWEENKIRIIAISAGIAVIGVGVIARKAYVKGFVDGGMVGVVIGADWLDKTFPEESHACELIERYAKEHPEEIVHRTGFGKWS